MIALVHKLSKRVARFLTKQGLLVEGSDNSYLNLDGLTANPMPDLHGHSITYRVALGAQRGKSARHSLINLENAFFARVLVTSSLKALN